jgi:hypothetical protein
MRSRCFAIVGTLMAALMPAASLAQAALRRRPD